MTEVMSELLSDFWDHLQGSDPGSCLTKTTQFLLEWKNWVQIRMTSDSIYFCTNSRDSGKVGNIYYKLWFIRNKDCPPLSSVDNTQPAPSVGGEELARWLRCYG